MTARVRWENLPAKLREQVRAQEGAPAKPSRGKGTGGLCPFVCTACGERFARYGVAVERHRDATGHLRYQVAHEHAILPSEHADDTKEPEETCPQP